jgi:hypothetical protein
VFVCCSNNQDLDFLRPIPVFCAATLVAGALATGACWRSGSVGRLVPELQERPSLSLVTSSHRGDGGKMQRRWDSFKWRLESCIFSSMLDGRRWRLPKLCDDGGRWPAVPSSSVTLMVEWRPPLFLLATSHIGGSFIVSSAALVGYGNHGDLVGPSGPSPATARFKPRGRCFRPDRVFFFQFGVLSVKARGLLVFPMFLLDLYVKCTVPPL